MPTYKMRAPNGRVYQIRGPAGATDEQIRREILRQFPESGKPARKPEPKPEPISRTEAVLLGAERGLKPISDFARSLNPLAYAGDVVENFLFPGLEQRRAQKEKRRVALAERAQTQRPGFFTGGEIAGEVIGTAPLIMTGGGVVAAGGRGLARTAGQGAAQLSGSSTRLGRFGAEYAKAVKKVGRGIQMGGRAVQTGGVGVRAPSRTAVAANAPTAATRTGRVALRVGGGGTAGVAAAALTDQDLVDAALTGSIIPLVGTIGRRGAGFVYDTLRGRLGEVRAAEIMRNLISSNPSEIATALRNAPTDARANTAEFLASQNLLTPELAAATRIASASAEGAPLEQVARARAAGQEEMRTALRGGATGTEAMQNIGAMRQQVGEVTDPMREEALRRTDIGRTVIVPAERQAAALRNDVQRELDSATQFVQDPNWSPSVAGRLAEARSAEEVAANLRAQGLQPLNIGTVVGDLRAKAAEAEFVNPPRARVLTEFANNLERRAAMMGGVIDATGLYELRKSMADTVADLLGPMEPGALQRRTAELVGEAKPLIDDAIEAAGGSGWRQYLNTFSAGMQNVERQQFARALEKLPEARFEQVMAGNDPDFVSKFFGPGRYDINVELFGGQLPVAQKLAGEIRASRDVASTAMSNMPPSLRLAHGTGARSRVAEAFQPGLRNVFARGLSRVAGGMPGMYGGGVAADQLAREVSQQISENAMRHLVPALVSPQGATRLMGAQSTANRMAQFINRLNPTQRAALAQTMQQGTMGVVQPVPAGPASEAPDMFEGALNEYDEFGNPLFDERGNYIGPR